VFNLDGIVKDFKDVHPPRAHSDIEDTLSGILISLRVEQYAKHAKPILWRFSGNTTFFRLVHLKKAHDAKDVIVLGIVIEVIAHP
jgi:hypothetical protein